MKTLLPTAFLTLGAVSGVAAAGDERAAIARILDAFHARDGFSGAVLVAKGSEVVYRGAFGLASLEHGVQNTTDTRFRLASLSKTFNALLVLRLVDAESIELTGTLAEYLPDLPADFADRITVEQLLSHQSGLYRDTLSASGRTRREHFTLDDLVEIICARELVGEPGAGYHYSSPGFVLLAATVEAVTGTSYEQALRAHVLEPLELDDTGLVAEGRVVPRLATRYLRLVDEVVVAPHQDPSFAIGAGDVYSTVDDLLKLGSALQTDGFLSTETRAAMFTDCGHGNGLGIYVSAYGTGAKFERAQGRVVHYSGGTSGVGTHLNVFLDHGITTVVLCNLTEIDVTDVSNRIANVVLGLGADLPLPNRKRDVARALLTDDPRSAIAELGALGRADRPSFGELFRLGFGFYDNHEPEKARKIATFVAGVYPDADWPHVLLGRIDARRDPQRAAAAFRAALERNPKSVSAARALQRLGER